ncbi:hypothetical protein PENSPDRAFT_670201 [Peniophora sp. CONT]|nr:hypothetical protein PENSPDRAFT_670201 [Peniophora sp. CONT]
MYAVPYAAITSLGTTLVVMTGHRTLKLARRVLHLSARRRVLEGLHHAATSIPAPAFALTTTRRIRSACHSALHDTIPDVMIGTKTKGAGEVREREGVAESDGGGRALSRRLLCMQGEDRCLYGSCCMPGSAIPFDPCAGVGVLRTSGKLAQINSILEDCRTSRSSYMLDCAVQTIPIHSGRVLQQSRQSQNIQADGTFI